MVSVFIIITVVAWDDGGSVGGCFGRGVRSTLSNPLRPRGRVILCACALGLQQLLQRLCVYSAFVASAVGLYRNAKAVLFQFVRMNCFLSCLACEHSA